MAGPTNKATSRSGFLCRCIYIRMSMSAIAMFQKQFKMPVWAYFEPSEGISGPIVVALLNTLSGEIYLLHTHARIIQTRPPNSITQIA